MCCVDACSYPPVLEDILLDGTKLTPTDNNNLAYFDRPKYNRAIGRIVGMSGTASSLSSTRTMSGTCRG